MSNIENVKTIEEKVEAEEFVLEQVLTTEPKFYNIVEETEEKYGFLETDVQALGAPYLNEAGTGLDLEAVVGSLLKIIKNDRDRITYLENKVSKITELYGIGE